ncbi:Ogr/Delta-like zinc finger [Actinobacillus lignieresii]|uniref:hypothetical protein n=1 Tax=Actinobacillus lignieresii TaxID=720 RepID=UPI000E183605|nr:hypothetical protein [Actinobacillus lignieresii]SUT96114.1 Ogr/Delta-like zinc finger [Actinobacillus lignieresii]
MARNCKKHCSVCASVARIQKTVKIADGLSQHYIYCTNPDCGRVWTENVEFAHEVRKSKLQEDNFDQLIKALPHEAVKKLSLACNSYLAKA